MPSQATVPDGHPHDPLKQASPPPQAWSQLPQWFGSVATRTHASPQLVCPAAEQPQLPFLQVWFAAHRFPQFPQLAGSVWMSVQVAPQISRPPEQVVGPSGWPPSQLPPGQVVIMVWHGSPDLQRFSSVRPQPMPTAATTPIATSAARVLVIDSCIPV